ncbi:hypothetical protein [Actinomadura atramentaria]|uniref:hypothetical protein n=1 Tax=Actinomadura atramentaria TaxID=1990 RepID=UPI000380BD82|nr:hypothetical protein [Actinomadura atramentaria]
MILLALLTGGIAALIWARQTRWYELLMLGGWGLLAAGTPMGQPVAGLLHDLSAQMGGWFQ